MTVDTLLEHGLERMSADAIDNFLQAQNHGVLGLPDRPAPYLLPLTFGYDGDDTLLFTFFVEGESRKVARSEAAEAASFLVYQADSAFLWQSVLLEGTVSELPASAWDDYEDAIPTAWRLELFERAKEAAGIRLFGIDVGDRAGLKYAEVPPGFASLGEELE